MNGQGFIAVTSLRLGLNFPRVGHSSIRVDRNHARRECAGGDEDAAPRWDADKETSGFPRIHRSFEPVPDLAERLGNAYWRLLWCPPDLEEPLDPE